MLEARKYTKTEMAEILETTDNQGISRKLQRYGVEFERSGRGDKLIFDIKAVPDKFKMYCISELGYDGRIDFRKLREFLYCYINDDEFRAMPDEVKEYRMRADENPISRQTIAKYTFQLKHLDIVNLDSGRYIYYFAFKDIQRVTEHKEYVMAWKQYWENRENEMASIDAISIMIATFGGVARKQAIPEFNAIYYNKIEELNRIILESIENELT